MSYILDALRKSEQQRQAIQPDSVTNRILVNQQQIPQKSHKWLVVLAVVNIAAVAFTAWIYLHKPNAGNPEKAEAIANTGWQAFSEKSGQQLRPDESKNSPQASPSLAMRHEQKSTGPSIAQMLEGKKDVPKATETHRTGQQASNKRTIAIKKDNKPTNIDGPKLADNPNDDASATLPALKELPSDSRNFLHKLNINVFGYTEKPEDRFVIIEMVKYKAGQVINGNVKLKEIRPDHIVLQDQNGTFTVERP